MECTQRLECTQDFNAEPLRHRSGSEQVGYLGICGNTYAVNIGPNKIGRDPQTCNIVLDMKSLSRQHAVINVIGQSKKEYMLMDLGSVNKTKLGIKTLQAYIPYPLKNGDTVQFGDVFGIFRLFEDETDLPMTQDIGIPDTPVNQRHITKIKNGGFTTVPESPDLSDKDDSFILSSQPPKDAAFKSPNNHFIKNTGKTILRPLIGSNKINNIFWMSSKKSPSIKLTLDESNESLDDSSSSANTVNTVVNTSKNVHDMDTQIPFVNNPNESTDSIYTANTQLPPINDTPSIHSLETQQPTSENLPIIQKINDQQEMEFEVSIANKGNSITLHNADTQLFEIDDIYEAQTQAMNDENTTKSIHDVNTQFVQDNSSSIHDSKTQILDSIQKNTVIELKSPISNVNYKEKLTVGNQEGSNSIHDANTEAFVANMESEGDASLPKNNIDSDKISHKTISESDEEMLLNEFDGDENEDSLVKSFKNNEIKSIKQNESDEEILFDDIDGSKFDDNLHSQPLLPYDTPCKNSNSTSDKENVPAINCEDTCSPIIGGKMTNKYRLQSDSSTDCDDLAILPTQIVTKTPVSDDDATDCEDEIFNKNTSNLDKSSRLSEEMPTLIVQKEEDILCFEDQPTQILEEDINNTKRNSENSFADLATQIIDKEQEYSEELISPFKVPQMSPLKTKRIESTNKSLPVNQDSDKNDDDKYYAATQDIVDDLCTQVLHSPISKNEENFQVGDKLRQTQSELSPTNKMLTTDKSSGSSDAKEKIVQYVASLSTKQIIDVIGGNEVSALTKKSSSDLSDIEITPKKKRPFKFMNVELPNTQEIKISVSQTVKSPENEKSCSESETEENSQESTPILFKKKTRTKKNDIKIDLTAKFDADALPTRVITRVRKPTAKIFDAEKGKDSILKSKFVNEQEDDIDSDIITENITRLKNNKKKTTQNSKNTPVTELAVKGDFSESKKNSDRKRNTRDESKTKDGKTSSRKKKITGSETVPKTKTVDNRTKSRSRKSNEKDKSAQSSVMDNTNKIADIIDLASELDHQEKPETRSTRGRSRLQKDRKSKSQKDLDKIPTRDEKKSVRRSTRQRATNDKSKNDSQTEKSHSSKNTMKETKPVLKSILKLTENKQNKSAVYNVSSELSDSPNNLKRPAVEPLESNPKRTRSAASTSINLRSTPARSASKQYVLFTAFPNEEVKIKLERLGAVIVTDVMTCTVLVTLQIKRTFKLLCVVGLGKPIVGPSWVQACSDNNVIVDPWLYLMHDETAEGRFNFSLERTLKGKRNFLKGYNVSATPSVMPSAPEMKLIVESSGGTWKEGGSNWLCVSTKDDKILWGALRRRGAVLVSTELILGGVLRQKLDIDSNRLKFTT